MNQRPPPPKPSKAPPEKQSTKKGWAYFLLCTYFAFEFIRPQDAYLSFIGPLRIPGIITLILPLMWLFSLEKSPLRERPVRLALAFVAVMAVTVTFAVNTFWVYQKTKFIFFVLFAAVLPAAALLARPDRMTHFLRFWVITNFVVAVGCLLSGGTGTGSFMGDENDLALALCMAIPYPFFLRRSPRVSRIHGLFLLGATATMILGVFATRSRGGFLGLVAVLGVMWWWSKNRVRNAILIAIVATAGSGVVVASAPKGYFDEMSTISDTKDETRQERLKSWGFGWDMFVANPILGVGAGNYPWTVHEYQLRQTLFPEKEKILGGREAHSLYFTLIPELGLVGITLWLAMVLSINARLRNAVKRVEQSSRDSDRAEELALAALAMRCSLVTFLVNAVFISVLYYPHFWYLVGFTVGLEKALDGIYSEPSAKLRHPELVRESELPVGGVTV